MLPPIALPTSTAGLAIAAVQCLNLAAFANEKSAPTGYSKFAEKGATIPSRTGMLVIYTPALATAGGCLAMAPAINGREALVASLLVVHFAKRVGEVLFVHKYSGNMGPMCYFIATFYALLSLLICVMTNNVPASLYADPASAAALPAALCLFAVGQLGNLYHHILLARMRKNKPATDWPAATEVAATPSAVEALGGAASAAAPPPTPATPSISAYTVPTGGLFPYVTMPHYSFEIVAWLGVALAAQQLNALLVAAGMASYLSGRAVASTHWYKQRFGDAYPKSRKHIVPFVF